jgi:hypothetical protein
MPKQHGVEDDEHTLHVNIKLHIDVPFSSLISGPLYTRARGPLTQGFHPH